MRKLCKFARIYEWCPCDGRGKGRNVDVGLNSFPVMRETQVCSNVWVWLYMSFHIIISMLCSNFGIHFIMHNLNACYISNKNKKKSIIRMQRNEYGFIHYIIDETCCVVIRKSTNNKQKNSIIILSHIINILQREFSISWELFINHNFEYMNLSMLSIVKV